MKDVKLYKLSGAGNTFVVLDGRGVDVSEFRRAERIQELCREFRTDGLMILNDGEMDFRMEFYNPDGSGGMMCGNGGRCIVAFADWLGIKPSAPDHYRFLAPDGPHSAEILSRPDGGRMTAWTVRLEMKDVDGIREMLGGYFLNTGTRHFVKFVEDVDAIDMEKDGSALRWNEAFAPEGTNVNFVQICDGHLKIRTFEKGVEGETLACGTGITASAIAAFYRGCGESAGLCPETIRLQARRGDMLTVDFTPIGPESFRKIHLTGPAEFV